MESSIIVAAHFQHGAAQVMGAQVSFRVESKHELPEIGAVFLQLPPAVHFNQGEELHAGGTQRMVGRNASRIEAAPQKLACTNSNRGGSANRQEHSSTWHNNESTVNTHRLNQG